MIHRKPRLFHRRTFARTAQGFHRRQVVAGLEQRRRTLVRGQGSAPREHVVRATVLFVGPTAATPFLVRLVPIVVFVSSISLGIFYGSAACCLLAFLAAGGILHLGGQVFPTLRHGKCKNVNVS